MSKGGRLLSINDAAKLSARPDLEQRVADLSEACRGWYETDEDLEDRLGPLREHLKKERAKAKAAAKNPPKAPAASDGWSTVSGGGKKRR